MKNKRLKNKIKYKNKIRKQQLTRISLEKKTDEDDCGVSDESFNRLKKKILEMNDGIVYKMRRNSALEKMSDILLEYAETFLRTIDSSNKDEYEKAIAVSTILWNCSIMQEDPRTREEINKMLEPIMPDAGSRSIVNYMLERRRQMYPNNNRLIVSYELTKKPNGDLHLSVASTVYETTAEK